MDDTDRMGGAASTDAGATPAQGGVAGGTYAPDDQSPAARRSRFRQDQLYPAEGGERDPAVPEPAPAR
jgi:hypothetical protein